MHHSVLSLSGGTVLKKAAILAGLHAATAFMAYTHGNADESFLTSWGESASEEPDGTLSPGCDPFDFTALSFVGSTSDVWKAIQNNRTESGPPLKAIPPLNLALLHACSLGGSSHQLLWALGMEDPNTLVRAADRGAAGFPEVVVSKTWNAASQGLSEDHLLSEHARRLYGNLAQGQTLGQALKDANTTYPPAGANANDTYHQMDIKPLGDGYARIVSVYTGDTDKPDYSPTNPLLAGHPGYYPYRWWLVNKQATP